MTEGLLDFNPTVRHLEAVSPSRSVALSECALREVWAANHVSQLLPPHPAARLGSIIHRLLQEAGEGKIPADKNAISRRWEELVSECQRDMSENWLERHLIPLSASVNEFEVRRIQAWRRTAVIAHDARKIGVASKWTEPDGYGFELSVSSSDNLVRGRIDAVLPSVNGPIIQDFKSGAIFSTEPNRGDFIKEEYRDQLRIYAALYACTYGIWPSRLELVPLADSPQQVDLEPSSCQDLLNRARDALKRINTIMATSGTRDDSEKALATPSPSGCRHCPYRPGCAAYRRERANYTEDADWPRDVWGPLVATNELGNGTLLLTLATPAGLVRIRGVSRGPRHPALMLLHEGDPFAAFSLRGTRSDQAFGELESTILYKIGGH